MERGRVYDRRHHRINFILSVPMEEEVKGRFKELKFTWPIIREFAVFIIAFLFYIDNKKKDSFIQELLLKSQSEKKEDAREYNRVIEKQILTMDKLIDFKKTVQNESDNRHSNSDSISGQ